MNSLPVKFKGKYRSGTRFTIRSLLKQLGMPKSVWHVRDFWGHNYGRLDLLLYDAKALYKAHVRAIHPRKQGDAEESAKTLNALWSEIQQRIKSKMELTIWIPNGKRRVALRDPAAAGLPGKYVRHCLYKNCRRVFATDHPRKMYCHRLHMQYAATTKFNDRVRAYKRRIWKHCADPKCNKPFVTLKPNKKFHSTICARRYHTRLCYHKFRDDRLERVHKWRADPANIEKMRVYRARQDVLERHRVHDRKRRVNSKVARARAAIERRRNRPWRRCICALESCKKPFKTQTPDKEYCENKCAIKASRKAATVRNRLRRIELKSKVLQLC